MNVSLHKRFLIATLIETAAVTYGLFDASNCVNQAICFGNWTIIWPALTALVLTLSLWLAMVIYRKLYGGKTSVGNDQKILYMIGAVGVVLIVLYGTYAFYSA